MHIAHIAKNRLRLLRIPRFSGFSGFAFFFWTLLMSFFTETCVSFSAEESVRRFRVENTIRTPGSEEVFKTTTLFRDAIVYDVIGEQGEITVFDSESKRFTLLEPARRIQTKIDGEQLRKTVEEKRAGFRSHKNPFVVFMVSPKFEIAHETETGHLRFQSKWIEYQCETQSMENAVLKNRYYDFCDWFCFLNLRLHPGSSTLFARMEINRYLRENGRFSEKIKVLVYPRGNGVMNQPEVSESSHTISPRLVPSDEKRIEQIHGQMETFRVVSLEEYQKQLNN